MNVVKKKGGKIWELLSLFNMIAKVDVSIKIRAESTALTYSAFEICSKNCHSVE